MYCSTCGSMIKDGQSFCANCGAHVAPPVQPAPQSPVRQVQSAQPSYQMTVPQPVPAVYQQPFQPMPQAVPAVTNVKAGPRRACFVVGLITCILLILETAPVFVIGGIIAFMGPVALILFGADTGDLFATGLLVCLGGFILMDIAIVSIVLNGICSKITAKRPASKCRSLRLAAAIMTVVDAAIVIAPVIGFNVVMSDAEFFYFIFGVTFLMATAFLVLAVITNIKDKKISC